MSSGHSHSHIRAPSCQSGRKEDAHVHQLEVYRDPGLRSELILDHPLQDLRLIPPQSNPDLQRHCISFSAVDVADCPVIVRVGRDERSHLVDQPLRRRWIRPGQLLLRRSDHQIVNSERLLSDLQQPGSQSSQVVSELADARGNTVSVGGKVCELPGQLLEEHGGSTLLAGEAFEVLSHLTDYSCLTRQFFH